MKKAFRRNMSANVLQLVINQFFNLLTFYLLSRALPKAAFGELNWALAVFLFVFTLASFGLDQIVIKKTVEQNSVQPLLSVYLSHVVFIGSGFYVLLLTASILFPHFFSIHSLLLLLGLAKLLLFFSTPFKAIAAGKERFRLVLYMSVSSAVIKGLAFLYLSYHNHLTLSAIVPIFIVADASELVLGAILIGKVWRIKPKPNFNYSNYQFFLKTALPQIGIVIFSSALARTDWILIGLFLSPERLAEYSFAYKAFEISSLPLLAIAPLLVPLFTRLKNASLPIQQHPRVLLLLRAELVIACFVVLCLNLLWNPYVDLLTGGKYGATNTQTIFILSLTLPVLYLNNFLWSMHFAFGNLRLILYSFILSFVLNLLGNLLLLPLFGNEGAATAYFIAILAQTVFYAVRLKDRFSFGLLSLVACSVCAVLSLWLSLFIPANTVWLLVIGSGFYILLLFCTVQIRQKDLKLFWQTVAG